MTALHRHRCCCNAPKSSFHFTIWIRYLFTGTFKYSICDVMWSDPNLMRCNAETVAVLSRLFSSRRAKSTTVVAWTTVENGWQFFSVDVLDGAISRYIHMSGDCQLNDCGENIDTRDVKKTMQSAPWNLFTNREISDIRDVDCRYWPINIKYIVYTFNIPTYMYITLH